MIQVFIVAKTSIFLLEYLKMCGLLNFCIKEEKEEESGNSDDNDQNFQQQQKGT